MGFNSGFKVLITPLWLVVRTSEMRSKKQPLNLSWY